MYKFFDEDDKIVIIMVGIILFCLIIIGIFIKCIQYQTAQERVSGIIYNTQNDTALGGNTRFKVRASENTYVSEHNESSYCVPKDSEYIPLINRAVEDKSIKVVVTAEKYFAIRWPWVCYPNVKVKIL